MIDRTTAPRIGSLASSEVDSSSDSESQSTGYDSLEGFAPLLSDAFSRMMPIQPRRIFPVSKICVKTLLAMLLGIEKLTPR